MGFTRYTYAKSSGCCTTARLLIRSTKGSRRSSKKWLQKNDCSRNKGTVFENYPNSHAFHDFHHFYSIYNKAEISLFTVRYKFSNEILSDFQTLCKGMGWGSGLLTHQQILYAFNFGLYLLNILHWSLVMVWSLFYREGIESSATKSSWWLRKWFLHWRVYTLSTWCPNKFCEKSWFFSRNWRENKLFPNIFASCDIWKFLLNSCPKLVIRTSV